MLCGEKRVDRRLTGTIWGNWRLSQLSEVLEFDMLQPMTALKRILISIVILLAGVQLMACGQVTTPVPTVTAMVTTMPGLTSVVSSITPSSVDPTAKTATAILLPSCTPIPNNYVYVIDYSVYINADAGLELGVWEAIGVLQQALEEHHPEWAQEEGLAEYVWDHSHAQMIGVNPRVLLVTAGVALDWQASEDQDLREEIVQVGVTLTQHYREFRFNEDLQANYPQVANAASYALYAFFDYDLAKLEAWQQEYDQMFGELQPRIIAEGCRTGFRHYRGGSACS